MKATQTKAISLAIRSGSFRWVSSKLNPPDLKVLKKFCKALHNFFRDVKSLVDTRPIYHKRDETIRGHVFCSFLALVLRKDLDKQLRTIDKDFEWYDIKHDLRALQQVIMEENQTKVALRTVCRGVCSDVLKAVGVAPPPTIKAIS